MRPMSIIVDVRESPVGGDFIMQRRVPALAVLTGIFAAPATGLAADIPVSMPTKAPPAVQESAQTWTVTVATEARYFSWSGNRGTPTTIAPANNQGASGSELYVPYAVQLLGRPNNDWKISLLGRGGWVWARQNTAGLTGEVETTTDTIFNGTVTYYGINGIQPFVALNANLPTGRSALFGTAAFARMDGDLVDIASFGEGLNIGPSVGFNLPLTQTFIITASGGYTWRDSYNRERSTSETNPNIQSPTSVNPGDVWTATTGIGYQGQRFSINGTGSLSEESTTSENGAPLYRAGRRYLFAGSTAYLWPESWGQTTLAGSFAHSNHNKVLFLGASQLIGETMNTNSDVWRVGLQHLFAFKQMAIGPTSSYLHRDHNGYDATTLQFVPAKDRYAAGALARFAINDRWTLNARVEHVWTHEYTHPALANGTQFSVLANAFVAASSAPVVNSTGWQAAFGINARL